MAKKATYEEVKHFVEIESNSGCKLLSQIYNNCEEKLLFRCACGAEFSTKYTKFKSQNKRQCNECGNRNGGNKQKKSNSQFVKEVNDLVGNEYTVLTEYNNTHDSIIMRHNICNHEYPVSPSNFLRGKRCPNCNGGVSMSHDEYSKRLFEKYGEEYKLITPYVKSIERVIIKHNVCGFEFPVFPYSILGDGSTCPWCSGLYQDTDRFKQWVFDNCGDEYKVLGEYEKASIKIKMLHAKCNHEFMITPNGFKNGHGCTKCKASKGEKRIDNYLSDCFINYKTQYRIKECRNKKPLPFDFAIFNNENTLLFLIEFQGRQHYDQIWARRNDKYSTLEYIQGNDKIKSDYCKENNINLIIIPYTDINNIETILSKELINYK